MEAYVVDLLPPFFLICIDNNCINYWITRSPRAKSFWSTIRLLSWLRATCRGYQRLLIARDMVIGKREVGGPVTHSTGVLQHACSYENNTLQVWAPFSMQPSRSIFVHVWCLAQQFPALGVVFPPRARAPFPHTHTFTAWCKVCVSTRKQIERCMRVLSFDDFSNAALPTLWNATR